ncbi:hypothetical protein, partial [Bacillus sp. CJ1]
MVRLQKRTAEDERKRLRPKGGRVADTNLHFADSGIASQQPDLADRRSAGFFVTGIALPRASAARNLRWIPAVDWRSSQPACGSVAVKEERKPVLSAAADFFSWSGTQPAVGVSCRNTLSLP